MNLEFPLALLGHLFSVCGTETKDGTTVPQDTKAEHRHFKEIWSRKKVNVNAENMTQNAALGGPSMQRNGGCCCGGVAGMCGWTLVGLLWLVNGCCWPSSFMKIVHRL